MLLKKIEGEYGIVARVNVPYVEEAIEWYEQKLGVKNQKKFHVEGIWAQLSFPGIHHFALGLSKGIPNPDPPEVYVTTIVVDDIESAHNELKEAGVNIGDIEDVGLGVKVAFFTDLVGNSLALRQNGKEHPKASFIGKD